MFLVWVYKPALPYLAYLPPSLLPSLPQAAWKRFIDIMTARADFYMGFTGQPSLTHNLSLLPSLPLTYAFAFP